MSNQKLWIEINNIYHETSIGAIRSSYLKALPRKWLFWGTYMLLLFWIPLLIIWLVQDHGYWGNFFQIISAIPLFWTVYYCSVVDHLKPFKNVGFGIIEQIGHLRYDRFYKMICNELGKNPEKLRSVLDWFEVKNSKFSIWNILIHSYLYRWLIVPLFGFLMYLLKDNRYLSDLKFNTWGLLVMLGLFLVVLIISLFEIYHIKNRNNFEICKLLKMSIIDMKNVESQDKLN